jgi:hypothetical protein
LRAGVPASPGLMCYRADESTFRTSPLFQLFRDGSSHKRASVAARATMCQKLVVSCMRMSYMRSNRKLDGAGLEVPGCGRTANAVRVLLARVFSNRLLLLVRTAWKQFADPSREPFNVLGVERLTPLGGAFSSEFPRRGVRRETGFRDVTVWSRSPTGSIRATGDSPFAPVGIRRLPAPYRYMGSPASHTCAMLRMINAQSNETVPGGKTRSSATANVHQRPLTIAPAVV